MRAVELLSLARRCVPGRGEPVLQHIGLGLVNESYRVERDGELYALRVAAPAPLQLGQSPQWECRVLALAAANDLAPVIAYCDAAQGVLVARWVRGRCLTSVEWRQADNMARIAQVMRCIHALPAPQPPRVMSPAAWVDCYRALLSRQGGAPAAHSATLEDRLADRLAAFAALPGGEAVLCHSDLHPLNLVDEDRRLTVLDWEYAHVSDPFWDLAGWSRLNDWCAELDRRLLSCYLGREPRPEENSRLELLAWLYDYVCLLWSAVYLGQQRGSPTKIIAARAERIAARLSSG